MGGIVLFDHSRNLCVDLFESTVIIQNIFYSKEKQVIQDILDVQVPLAGIHTALKKTKYKWIFVVSCDRPQVYETTAAGIR